MTDRPQIVMMPIQRPAWMQQQAQQQQGGLRGLLGGGLARRIENPDTLNQAVRGIGNFFGRATQPAQDLGAWAACPISNLLMNPFQYNQAVRNRANMPGQRANTIRR
jgi:hypothetical protein